ncbi:hypothetical protein LX32DRAFT_49995 [Colletotrichum zoysiae]|uniref:Uncharacterized protein n=1 Tax=Colletotrichum zoysiae TaxID=1216348 RepID=A0AAD9HB78_9PEZI|nr:hypothetical protein LX32DRAFT_49995 [Colletotrichum zoysiae]
MRPESRRQPPRAHPESTGPQFLVGVDDDGVQVHKTQGNDVLFYSPPPPPSRTTCDLSHADHTFTPKLPSAAFFRALGWSAFVGDAPARCVRAHPVTHCHADADSPSSSEPPQQPAPVRRVVCVCVGGAPGYITDQCFPSPCFLFSSPFQPNGR